ncbi:hypothetical protein BH11BAC7_BH11BAC7_35480 [soil metagenome]
MKKIRMFCLLMPLFFILHAFITITYDAKFVTFSVYTDSEKLTYQAIKFDRKDNRVRIKYFAAKDFDRKSVPRRYADWSTGRNIISVCSGTYMQSCKPDASPVGLTIDQGWLVNKLISDSMDAIVIVYATGGIDVSNIKAGNLKVNNNDRIYNLKSSLDKGAFISWAQKAEATVFQTHLLYYKNEIKIYDHSSPALRERRFLVGCTDKNGNLFNYIIHISNEVTLLTGVRSVATFLKVEERMRNIDFIINLDMGCQDHLTAYNSNGTVNLDFKGRVKIDKCVNLLSFYFE